MNKETNEKEKIIELMNNKYGLWNHEKKRMREALSLAEKSFNEKVKEKFNDMGFVENVIKPYLNDYYKKEGKSTKGELLVEVAERQIKIDQLQTELDKTQRAIECLFRPKEELKKEGD